MTLYTQADMPTWAFDPLLKTRKGSFVPKDAHITDYVISYVIPMQPMSEEMSAFMRLLYDFRPLRS